LRLSSTSGDDEPEHNRFIFQFQKPTTMKWDCCWPLAGLGAGCSTFATMKRSASNQAAAAAVAPSASKLGAIDHALQQPDCGQPSKLSPTCCPSGHDMYVTHNKNLQWRKRRKALEKSIA
jgi:hypothetical protein